MIAVQRIAGYRQARIRMARKMPLSPSALLVPAGAREQDWQSEDAATSSTGTGQMMLIRRFEEKLLELEKAGLIHGPAHASIRPGSGRRSARCRSSAATTRSTARIGAHHQVLTKLVGAVLPNNFDIRKDAYTPEMDEAIHRFMGEIMGLTPGYCGGRGGSMHMRYAEAGIVGTSAIVGGNRPTPSVMRLADKMLGREEHLGDLLRRRRRAGGRQLLRR